MFGKKSKFQNDLEIFTIYDSKTRSYEIPTFATCTDDLIREVINMFKDPSQSRNRFLLNAEDFSIYKIASYDKKTGLIESQQLEHVANMHDLRALATPAKPDVGIVPT